VRAIDGSWRLYEVDGGGGTYTVAAMLWPDEGDHPQRAVLDVRCSCPAGQAKRTCHHLLTVLALLERDGYRLET
jgi:hypothetical protein